MLTVPSSWLVSVTCAKLVETVMSSTTISEVMLFRTSEPPVSVTSAVTGWPYCMACSCHSAQSSCAVISAIAGEAAMSAAVESVR